MNHHCHIQVQPSGLKNVLQSDGASPVTNENNDLFPWVFKAVAGGRGKRSDDVIFWAVNIGIIGFAAGLLFDVTPLIHTFVPIMGLGLLHALATYARRLLATPA